jgi:hypothetical protein
MKNNPFLARLADKHPDEIKAIIKFTAEMGETQEGGECWSMKSSEFIDRVYAAIENQNMDDDPEEIFW